MMRPLAPANNAIACKSRRLTSRPPAILIVLAGRINRKSAIYLMISMGSSGSTSPAAELQTTGSTSRLTRASQPVAQPTAAQQQAQHSQATLQQPAQTTRAQTPAQSEQPSTASSPPAGSQLYTVEDGDTLWDIAAAFDTTVDDILAANNLDNASNLQLGQELVIPAPSDTGAAPAQ